MKRVSLEKMVNISLIQSFQDAFSDFSGLAAAFFDYDGSMVTKCRGIEKFCGDNISGSENSFKKWFECYQIAAKKSFEDRSPCIYKCHTGLFNIAVPIIMNDIPIGNLFAGQAVCYDDELFTGLDFSEGEAESSFSRETLEGTPCLSIYELRSIASFLHKMCRIISGIAADNRILMKNTRIPGYDAFVKANRDVMDFSGMINSNTEFFISKIKQILNSYNGNNSGKVLEALEEAFSELQISVDNISADIDYFSGMEESDSFYIVHELLNNISDRTEEICRNKNIQCIFNFSNDMPYKMLGKKKLIQHAVENLILFLVNIIDCTDMEISFSVNRINYSSCLVIEVIIMGNELNEVQIENIEEKIAERDAFKIKNSDILTRYSSVTYTILDRLSGSIKLKNIDGKGTASCIIIPQLSEGGDN